MPLEEEEGIPPDSHFPIIISSSALVVLEYSDLVGCFAIDSLVSWTQVLTV